MKVLVPLRDAFDNLNFLGHPKIMGGDSRKAMRTLLIASQGEPLRDDEEPAHWQPLTGREHAPLVRAREFHLLAGRRSGKSSGVSALAIYFATMIDYSDVLRSGETGVILVLASSREQSSTLFDYIAEPFDDLPMLKGLAASRTTSSITLRTHVRIEVRAASQRSLRGPTYIAVLCDEIGVWRNDESGANPDMEIITAVRPGLLTTKGQLITLGTPFAKRGFAYDRFTRYYGASGDPQIIVAKGPTRAFNPSLTEEEIERDIEISPNPAASRVEYAGEFRGDVEAHFPRELIEDAVTLGLYELPRIGGVSYVAFVDPASGSGADEMTLAVGHLNGSIAVLDSLTAVRAPFSTDDVVERFSGILADYGVTSVVGDAYAKGWPAARFASNGITYEDSKKSASDLYREALPAFTSHRVELLDNPKLVAQFVGLDRSIAKSGKESIGHAHGMHDDLANAVAGMLTQLTGKYDLVLTRYNDFLTAGAPVETSARNCAAMFAVLTMDKEGRAAVGYFAVTKIRPCALVLVDFETGIYKLSVHDRIMARMDELTTAHGLNEYCIFTTSALAADAQARGYNVLSLIKLEGREDLGAVAESYVSGGRVKIGAGAYAKSRTEPLSLDFRYGKTDDPLKQAMIYGAVAGLDEASA
jgi:hypothetical protein